MVLELSSNENEIGCTCSTHERKVFYNIQSEKPESRKQLKDVGMDLKII
jgi:hypothetical protein